MLTLLSAITKDRKKPSLRQQRQKCLLANLSVTTKNRVLDLLSAMALEMPIWVLLMSIGLFRKHTEYIDVTLHRG